MIASVYVLLTVAENLILNPATIIWPAFNPSARLSANSEGMVWTAVSVVQQAHVYKASLPEVQPNGGCEAELKGEKET